MVTARTRNVSECLYSLYAWFDIIGTFVLAARGNGVVYAVGCVCVCLSTWNVGILWLNESRWCLVWKLPHRTATLYWIWVAIRRGKKGDVLLRKWTSVAYPVSKIHVRTSLTLILMNASVKDLCMSPHVIAGPPGQSSRNSGKRCQLARLLTLPIFVALWQKVCEISAVENLCSPEKWTKVRQNNHQNTCYTEMPHDKFHHARPNDVREKRY